MASNDGGGDDLSSDGRRKREASGELSYLCSHGKEVRYSEKGGSARWSDNCATCLEKHWPKCVKEAEQDDAGVMPPAKKAKLTIHVNNANAEAAEATGPLDPQCAKTELDQKRHEQSDQEGKEVPDHEEDKDFESELKQLHQQHQAAQEEAQKCHKAFVWRLIAKVDELQKVVDKSNNEKNTRDKELQEFLNRYKAVASDHLKLTQEKHEEQVRQLQQRLDETEEQDRQLQQRLDDSQEQVRQLQQGSETSGKQLNEANQHITEAHEMVKKLRNDLGVWSEWYKEGAKADGLKRMAEWYEEMAPLSQGSQIWQQR
ncbi:uncharacterized protein AB675_7712 [Cyphellophora attinorum]|uniref:Uncharacterized protein n=1 Tax=Cyphellophora attinorum TaxID=1664694 RepID=A0A0N1HU79_9EURO|nr:uncharacterized protein AB675_7712 [Phialophora attinorum]KPI40360.1 hypothetical protein AB675_7712 [Phialophora attinorum]